jgi:hypothetical protein
MTTELPDKTDAAAEPAEDVTLNLDKLEREDTKGPFAYLHAGRRWVLNDPEDIDWQELLSSVGNPVMMLRAALPPDDRDAFFKSPMPTWKMKALAKNYQDHYGLPDVPEGDALPA